MEHTAILRIRGGNGNTLQEKLFRRDTYDAATTGKRGETERYY